MLSFNRRFIHAPATICGAVLLAACAQTPSATPQTPNPVGEVKGTATQHTAASSAGVVQRAAVVLPASVTGGAVYVGTFANAPNAPKETKGRAPVVVFMHGSSGLELKAIGEWQLWLASLGVASFAPDSFALPDRLTYKSPVGKDVYEKIHALRASEIQLALAALRSAAWADTSRLVLAGTSEGGPAVARYVGNEFAGRMLYSWSCETNYFVQWPLAVLLPCTPSPSQALLGEKNTSVRLITFSTGWVMAAVRWSCTK